VFGVSSERRSWLSSVGAGNQEPGKQTASGGTVGAGEQGNEADKALELKILHDGLGVINVRFAAYCRCSPDIAARTETGPTATELPLPA
jgi:hypothetical protein